MIDTYVYVCMYVYNLLKKLKVKEQMSFLVENTLNSTQMSASVGRTCRYARYASTMS